MIFSLVVFTNFALWLLIPKWEVTGTGPWADNRNCFHLTEVPKLVYYLLVICDANFPSFQLKQKVNKTQGTASLNWFIKVRTTEVLIRAENIHFFVLLRKQLLLTQEVHENGKEAIIKAVSNTEWWSSQMENTLSCTTPLPWHKHFYVEPL